MRYKKTRQTDTTKMWKSFNNFSVLLICGKWGKIIFNSF
jgi:hypothetical protein